MQRRRGKEINYLVFSCRSKEISKEGRNKRCVKSEWRKAANRRKMSLYPVCPFTVTGHLRWCSITCVWRLEGVLGWWSWGKGCCGGGVWREVKVGLEIVEEWVEEWW